MKDWHDMHSVFLDTNFFLDILDKSRPRHDRANAVLVTFIEHNVQLYTSSDIMSTVSYFLQKSLGIQKTVLSIGYIIESVDVLSLTNSDFLALNEIILKYYSGGHIDYEDCMQMYLAHKHRIDAIVTSDKRFCETMRKFFDMDIVLLDDIKFSGQ